MMYHFCPNHEHWFIIGQQKDKKNSAQPLWLRTIIITDEFVLTNKEELLHFLEFA